MHKTLDRGDIPTADRLLKAVQGLGMGNYYIWAANGDWVATGVYLDGRGRLCLKMVNAQAVDWDSDGEEDRK